MPQNIVDIANLIEVPSEGISFSLSDVSDLHYRVFANGPFAVDLENTPLQADPNVWVSLIAKNATRLSYRPLKGCTTMYIELQLTDRETGEQIDPIPMAVEVPASPTLSLAEQIKAIMRRELEAHDEMLSRGQPLVWDDEDDGMQSLYEDPRDFQTLDQAFPGHNAQKSTASHPQQTTQEETLSPETE